MQNQDNIDNIYNIIQFLRNDGSSKYYRVRNVNNNTEYMAKVFTKNENKFQHEFQMTTKASNLNNPYIIHLYNHGTGTITRGANVQNNKNYLILDYYSKGDLLKYCKAGGRFSEKHAKVIFLKILNGVRALHGAGICHRALALANIFLDQHFNPRICDFSVSTSFQGNNGIINLNDLVGFVNYASPQIFQNKTYNGPKADIFSLGVILFNLVVGQIGFEQAVIQDNLYKLIIRNEIDTYWKVSNIEKLNLNLSQEFKNLYIRMISYNENNRPTIDQILNDKWFNELRGLNNDQLNQIEDEVRNEFLTRENLVQEIQLHLQNNLEDEEDA